jgi:hypothetical protein
MIDRKMGLPLHRVRWLSIEQIAKLWGDEVGYDPKIIQHELQLGLLNLPRIEAGLRPLDKLPPAEELPPIETHFSRDDIPKFCDKQGWPVPGFWFGREVREKGYAGRPAKKKRAILQELERRAQAGELHNRVRAEAQYLSEWAAEKFPDEEVATPRTIENNIRERHRQLCAPRKENN